MTVTQAATWIEAAEDEEGAADGIVDGDASQRVSRQGGKGDDYRSGAAAGEPG